MRERPSSRNMLYTVACMAILAANMPFAHSYAGPGDSELVSSSFEEDLLRNYTSWLHRNKAEYMSVGRHVQSAFTPSLLVPLCVCNIKMSTFIICDLRLFRNVST